mmetsp:Transcript_45974/g.111924  ORF Transcript_45974/g.111924 Transcript_45974/m.111924 type:complete len:254 (-) Transcript_45974:155-916(-)
MGVGAVAGHLLAEEVEHYRCGIGVILESDQEGRTRIGGLIKGGTGFNSDLEHSDELLAVDQHVVERGMRIEDVAAYIRGKEGSILTLVVRKRGGMIATVKLVRQRLPGAKAEMLGALWQSPTSGKKPKGPISIGEKLDLLMQLRKRGNISSDEYEQAERRLRNSGLQGVESFDVGSDRSLPPDHAHWFDGGIPRVERASEGTVTPVSTPPPHWNLPKLNGGDESPSSPQTTTWQPVKRNLDLEYNTRHTTFTM